MAEPTLTQVFGPGATLTATSLNILLADLSANGLDITGSPTAEGLLVALLMEIRKILTEVNYGTNLDQSIYIEDGFSTENIRGVANSAFKVEPVIVNLTRPKTSTIFDPNAY